MSARLGVLIVHGMGDPPQSYAEDLIAAVRRHLGARALETEFEACFWSPILQEQQNVTWQRACQTAGLRWGRLRKWCVSALGDPASYLSGYLKKNGRPVYETVHECVRESLERLSLRLEQGASAPLVALAHSLGGTILSNYIWDEQHGNGVGQTAFERTETLTTLVTYGCNIPLFLPPKPPIECITLVPPRCWINIYGTSDVLGYPIKHIWDRLNGTDIEDIGMMIGPWPIALTPLSHTRYHADGGFVRLVSCELNRLLAGPPSAAAEV